MAVRRNVLQENDILCELYGDRSSDFSDFSDSESLDSDIERDSDIPTTSRKQLRSSVVVVTSDSETSAIGEESSEPETSDNKTSDVWCKTDKKTNQWVCPWNHRSQYSN